MGKSCRTLPVPRIGDLLTGLPLPPHKTQRWDEPAAREHLERAGVLLIEVHDRSLGGGSSSRGTQEHRHHAIGAGVREYLTRTTVDNHGSDARRRV